MLCALCVRALYALEGVFSLPMWWVVHALRIYVSSVCALRVCMLTPSNPNYVGTTVNGVCVMFCVGYVLGR